MTMKFPITPQDSKRHETYAQVKILMFHRVVNDDRLSREYPQVCVHILEFRRCLRLLEQWGFTAITLNDYRLSLGGEMDLPKKPVILSFDDGYLDVYRNAFPLLLEFGMTAVVFAVANQEILDNCWDQGTRFPSAPLMNGRQLLELHEAGFEIGSHTISHPRLTAIPADRAWDEISRSRMMLEILLNSPVRSFAYPYGLMSDAVKTMVIDAGYENACSVFTGPPVFGADPFQVRRTLIPGSSSGAGFALRMLTPYETLSWIRWKAKLILSGNGTQRAMVPDEPAGQPANEGQHG